MSEMNANYLSYKTKSRDLLLTGEYNSLFNDLKLNLPTRFYVYAKPESLNNLFKNTYRNLTNSTDRINAHDAWAFDEIQRELMMPENIMDFTRSINYLVRNCKIPEKHIYIKNGNVAGELFPSRKIYLSRYAMCLVVKNLLNASKSFKSDCAAPLFTTPGAHTDTAEKQFMHEMRIVFAGYFYAFPQTPIDEIINTTWMWVRGARLKNSYQSANNDLRYLMQKIYGDEFNFHMFEEFKQSNIFDTLFYSPARGNFMAQYENILKDMGYELKCTPRDQFPKWRLTNKVAPKYPGAFFAPHVSFLMIWLLQHFCKFIESEKMPKNNRAKWFQDLTRRFFATIRGAMLMEKYNNKNTNRDFSMAPLFVEQHHSDAHKIVAAIKNGTGPTVIDSQTGKKTRDNPSALDFYRENHLFGEDDIWCLHYRKTAEQKVAALHKQYMAQPSMELANKIHDAEKNIMDENMAIYGINLSAFVSVPQILNHKSEFVPRPCIGPQDMASGFILPDDHQITPAFDTQLQFEFKDYLNPAMPYGKFEIIRPTTIPSGIPFTRGISQITGHPYVIYDPNGEFESVNPPVANPTVLDVKGNPKNRDVNFQQINYLFESDTLTIDEQLRQAHRLVALGVINKVVFSGNKSYHMRCTVGTPPQTKEERKWLFNHIIEKYDIRGIDVVCWNNGRLMRRADAVRNVGGATVRQELLHQTNVVLNINWRPLYNEYAARRQEYINNMPITNGINEKLANRVKIMLTGWYDGNRHNLLDQGLIPMMYYAGWSPNEIRNTLANAGVNPNLQNTIEKYIANIR